MPIDSLVKNLIIECIQRDCSSLDNSQAFFHAGPGPVMWDNYFNNQFPARSLCGKLKSQIAKIYQKKIKDSGHESDTARNLIIAVLASYTSAIIAPVEVSLSIIPMIFSVKYLCSGISSMIKWKKMNDTYDEIADIEYDQLAEYVEEIKQEKNRS